MSKTGLEVAEPYPNDSTIQYSDRKSPGFSKKICIRLSMITVEPIVLCYILGLIIATLATQNLNLEKACRVNLSIDKETCDAIKSRNITGYNKTQEVAVQKVVASAYVWKFALHSIFSVIYLAFVGSWSDRNERRKICIVTPLLGEICSILTLLSCTYFYYELPMEVNIIAEILSAFLTGGMGVFVVGIFTFVCSKTTLQERTVRVGVIHVLFQLGVTVGLAASGVLLYNLGFYGVYSTSLTLYVLALVYGVLFIKEERTNLNVLRKKIGFLRDFFDIKSLKNTFAIAVRNEDKQKQKRIRFIMVIAMLVVGPMHGEIGVLYLYTRYKFYWNEVDFGIFFSCAAIIHLVAATASLFLFSKLLKMDDSLIGCIAAVSKIAGSLMFAFAPNGTIFYMGIGVDVLSSVLFITMRSIVTKQVGSAELGKMNSIFGLAESIVPLIYGPLYSAVYKETITIFPGMFYVVSAVMTIPVFAIYTWLYVNRIPLNDETPEDTDKREKLLVK